VKRFKEGLLKTQIQKQLILKATVFIWELGAGVYLLSQTLANSFQISNFRSWLLNGAVNIEISQRWIVE
jgi:hypothetical protein